MFKIVNLLTVFCLLAGCFPLSITVAQTSSNQHYILNLNKIETVVEQTPTPLPSSPPTKPQKPVLQNSLEKAPLRFSLSSEIIDFGPLSPTNQVIRTNSISIYNKGSQPVNVLVFADHSLQDPQNNSIPNTTCDNGNCNIDSPYEWKSNLTYGLGYRCDSIQGLICSANPITPSFFKPFPNTSIGDSSQEIFSLPGDMLSGSGEITYKVNIPPTQPNGFYTNTVTYILIPSL